MRCHNEMIVNTFSLAKLIKLLVIYVALLFINDSLLLERAEALDSRIIEEEDDDDGFGYEDDGVVDMKRFDPLESINRKIFWLNNGISIVILNPINTFYRELVPKPVKSSIRNLLSNLSSPLRIVYGLLSLNSDLIKKETGRFFVNTTFGVLGLFDPASNRQYLKRINFLGDDLLKNYGGTEGCYLVLPVIGPSTVRSAFGIMLDNALDPSSFYFNTEANMTRYGLYILDGFGAGEKIFTNLNQISIDEYSAIRSVYMQYRKRGQ
jgi:phospholipid-binding lipoprotein MlaA